MKYCVEIQKLPYEKLGNAFLYMSAVLALVNILFFRSTEEIIQIGFIASVYSAVIVAVTAIILDKRYSRHLTSDLMEDIADIIEEIELPDAEIDQTDAIE